jgi:hypothetical protein
MVNAVFVDNTKKVKVTFTNQTPLIHMKASPAIADQSAKEKTLPHRHKESITYPTLEGSLHLSSSETPSDVPFDP